MAGWPERHMTELGGAANGVHSQDVELTAVGHDASRCILSQPSSGGVERGCIIALERPNTASASAIDVRLHEELHDVHAKNRASAASRL
jgi:hypothetical protein